MKYSTIGYILGQVLKFEGIFMLLPFLTGMIYHENEAYSYLIIGIICFVLGCLITLKKVKHPQIFNREGFVAVALSWIVLSIFGAIPFVITGEIPSYVDALFETISGFTTTGASILSNVEALTHTSLMWRSFTHWVGGMGVLVFIMSFLPLMGGSTINLMKAESPGPSVSRLVPHVKDTAKILYRIYLVITIIEIVLLCIFGMPMFDSLTLTFGTVGTGGFGIHNDSIAGYSPVLQNIITVFMILSGVNYVAYFYIMTKQLKEREEELEEEAYRDKLTGIGNRHLFHERAETMLATGEKIVFCYCDLDHLKYVNDHFGHQEGDRYLLYFVETVKENIRPGDLFVRLGGDEFCVVLLNCSQETMQEKFRNIHEAFRREGAGDYPKSFSYGIIELPERHDIVSTDEILQRADEVMYEYKRKHKEKYLKQLEK